MDKVAWFVFEAWNKPRRKDTCFDNLSNIGINMLNDVMRRGGVEYGYCNVDTASRFDLVMVSFTSPYDVLAFYKEVARHKDWQPHARKFKVVAGGFGMMNPFVAGEFVDYVFFGRAEHVFLDMIKNIQDFEHPSFMRLDSPKSCVMCQTDSLYPHTFDIDLKRSHNRTYTEQALGCPNCCYFCHYRFARKVIKTSEHFNFSLYKESQELDMFNVEDINVKAIRYTIGLDGASEKLRMIVNKKISREKFRYQIKSIHDKKMEAGIPNMFISLYNIINYEDETVDDLEELKEDINYFKEVCRDMKIASINIHNTPFVPSILTPSEYAAFSIEPKNKAIVPGSALTRLTDNFVSFIDQYTPSIYAQFENLLVNRFSERNRRLVDIICFSRKFAKLNTGDRMRYLADYEDINDIVREYSVDEQLPSWFIESYTPRETLRKMRIRMKNTANNFKTNKI